MKKHSFAIFSLLTLLLLAGCTKPQQDTVQETVLSEADETDSSYISLTLNEFHTIQAEVEEGEYTQLDACVLETLPVSVEDALSIFAPEDTGTCTLRETGEGSSLTSQENHCYISPYRVLFEKEKEEQSSANDEILNLLELYAEENPDGAWQSLDFIDQTEAIQRVEALLEALGVNLEPVMEASAALTGQAIMDYQQKRLQRDAVSEEKTYDPFGKAYLLENLSQEKDACFLSFTFSYQGVPVFDGSPTVSYISGVVPPYPTTLSVLITREGLQIFDGLYLHRVGVSERSGDILTAAEAAERYRQKYDLVIPTGEYIRRVTRIYLEYLPIEQDAGIVLTPYWCFPMETEYSSGWYDSGAERFNAFTGEDLTYGG